MDTRINNLDGLLLRDVRWSVKTAGPSPYNNERTEIFLLGCQKAMMGNPCKGCFNSTTWDSSKAEFSHDPVLMAEHINNVAPNKYITIGGGEPTDQIDNLIILCKELKKYGFHTMIYTWRSLKYMTSRPPIYNLTDEHAEHHKNYIGMQRITELLNYVDIVVDGEYKEEERLWDGNKGDGLISSIGSGNQIVWNAKKGIGFAMKDIDELFITESNDLQYILKDLNVEMHKIDTKR